MYPEKQNDYNFEIDFDNVRKISGFNIENHEIKEILKHLEIKMKIVKGNVAKLVVPNYRNDVKREIDVIEEVMRIYGYNNIWCQKK